MNKQHAARLCFALLSAIALGVPGCSSDDDDQDAPESPLGGSSPGSGGTSAGRGGSTSRAGSGQAGAGGNRCVDVTPVSGQSCQSVDAGRYCPGASGEQCICTAQGQQQRGRQGARVWMCFGGIPPQPQGGAGGAPDMPVAGAPSQAGAPSEGGSAGATGGAGGAEPSGGQPAAGAAGSAGESAMGGAGGAAAGEGGGGSP